MFRSVAYYCVFKIICLCVGFSGYFFEYVQQFPSRFLNLLVFLFCKKLIKVTDFDVYETSSLRAILFIRLFPIFDNLFFEENVSKVIQREFVLTSGILF